MNAINPFPPVSFNVMAKPVGSRCNLNCDYCYYKGKENLYRTGLATENPLIIDKDHWIEIRCKTKGSSIVYQVNHKGYTSNHWYLYKGPFKIAAGDTVSAIAHWIGFKESAMIESVCK